MNLEKELWIYAPVTDCGKPERSVWGMMAKAQSIVGGGQWRVCCVAMGGDTREAAEELAGYAEKVYSVSGESLKYPDHMRYTDELVSLIEREKPEVVLFSVSSFNSVLAAAVGARLKTGVIAHAVDIRMDEEGCAVGVIPAFGGNFMGDITCPAKRPQIVGVRAADDCPEKLPHRGEIVSVQANGCGGRSYTFVGESLPGGEGKAIENAEFILCGGLGVGSAENWQVLTEDAKLLGAEVACTRPPVDEGWVDTEKKMIGISGKYVSPKIYVGFGVSGSSHHMCGMRDAKLIVNVNRDINALSMHNSDYVAEADAAEVLKALKELLAEKSRGC